MALRVRWSEAEIKRALYLYFQLPFGKLHSRNPEIITLASSLGRTPSSVAMKLVNFASLDPKIRDSGRKGLEGASALDREVWNQFHDDWTKLIMEAGADEAMETSSNERVSDARQSYNFEPPIGPTTRLAEVVQRRGQSFFRRAVLANFDNKCCVTGIAEPRLLLASHISPWQTDVENRHNPRNGLCFSATFDRAFDRYLMTVTPDLNVRLSDQLLHSDSVETRAYFSPYEGAKLIAPTHLRPDEALLILHNDKFALLAA